jgi:hypothetical protein
VNGTNGMKPDTMIEKVDKPEVDAGHERSKLFRRALARSKIEKYKEEKQLQANLYDVLSDQPEPHRPK